MEDSEKPSALKDVPTTVNDSSENFTDGKIISWSFDSEKAQILSDNPATVSGSSNASGEFTFCKIEGLESDFEGAPTNVQNNTEYHRQLSRLREVDELRHKLAVAEKALGFYKDQWRYRGNVACPLNIEPNIKGDWDRGEIAKQALAVMRGDK